MVGLPRASTKGWILVLNPPREPPIAWSAPTFLGAGARLVGAHDGAVDHRIFVVCLRREGLEHALPDTGFGPAVEPPVHALPLAQTVRQIAPWDAGAVAIHESNKPTRRTPPPCSP